MHWEAPIECSGCHPFRSESDGLLLSGLETPAPCSSLSVRFDRRPGGDSGIGDASQLLGPAAPSSISSTSSLEGSGHAPAPGTHDANPATTGGVAPLDQHEVVESPESGGVSRGVVVGVVVACSVAFVLTGTLAGWSVYTLRRRARMGSSPGSQLGPSNRGPPITPAAMGEGGAGNKAAEVRLHALLAHRRPRVHHVVSTQALLLQVSGYGVMFQGDIGRESPDLKAGLRLQHAASIDENQPSTSDPSPGALRVPSALATVQSPPLIPAVARDKGKMGSPTSGAGLLLDQDIEPIPVCPSQVELCGGPGRVTSCTPWPRST